MSFYQRMSLQRNTLLINPDFQIKGIWKNINLVIQIATIRSYQDYIILQFWLIFWNILYNFRLVVSDGSEGDFGVCPADPASCKILTDMKTKADDEGRQNITWQSIGLPKASWQTPGNWMAHLAWAGTSQSLLPLTKPQHCTQLQRKMSWRATWFWPL